MRKLFQNLVFVLLCLGNAYAQQTIVVQPGTSLEGVRNQIRSINKKMKRDITVLLKNGTYRLSAPLELTDVDGGRNNFKVIWKAETPGKVFFSGGRTVTEWTLFDAAKNIYKAKVGDLNFRQIYVNNTLATRARTPNKIDEGTMAPYYKIKGVNKINKTLSVKSSEVSAAWSNFNNIELIVYPSWYHIRFLLDTVITVDTVSTISFIPPVGNSGFNNPANYYTNASYFFENAYEFLDAEGEWYLDTAEDVLYYKPRSGESMSNIEVVIPAVETLISVKGSNAARVSNITFQGIVFEHSTWTLPSTKGLVATQALQPQPLDLNGSTSPNNRPPGAVRVDFGDSINFRNNTFTRLGANGLVYFTADKNCLIDGNTFEKLSGNGLVIDAFNKRSPGEEIICKGFKVTNNLFQKVGLDYTNSVGMLANIVEDLVFENNKLTDMPYIALQVGTQSGGYREIGIKNVSISYNDISDFTNIHNDGAGVYTLAFQPGCMIKENYIHDWKRSPFDPDKGAPSSGIYLDNYGKYQILDHNLITGFDEKAFRTHAIFLQTTTPADGIVMINNTTRDQCIIDGAGPGKRNKSCTSVCSPPPVPRLHSFADNKLTWSKVEGATGYLLWMGHDRPGGRYTRYIDVGNVNSYTISDEVKPIWVAVQSYKSTISCRLNKYSNEMGSSVINPVEDVYLRSGTYQTDSFAESKELNVYHSDDGNNDRESYLKFNLSGIPQRVTSAKVRLTVKADNSGVSNQQVRMQVIPNTWSENTITWAGKVVPISIVGSSALPSGGKWIEFDVTAQVNRALNSDKMLSLSLSADGEGHSGFISSDTSEVGIRPQLLYTVDCSPPPAPIINSMSKKQLSWTKVAGATGYRICISRAGSGAYTEFIDVGDVDKFTFKAGKGKFWIALQSYNVAASCATSYSNEITASF
jgi:hypothetical protein